MNQANATVRMTSLDQTESLAATLVRPDRYRELERLLADDVPLIARGAGLTYCLASAGEGVASVCLSRFDRFLRFDAAGPRLEVEAGATLGSLAELVASRGFWFPVLPGYPSITVGGAIAMNVHGKSQFHAGLFGDWVESFELLHPKMGRVHCDRSRNAELFRLTVGGFGLTGLIVKATLKLESLRGKRLLRRRIRVKSLIEAAETMRAQEESADCTYSWNDLHRGGAGFVYVETPADGGDVGTLPRPRRPLRAEAAPRRWVRALAPAALRAIRPAYRCLEALGGESRELALLEGAFPLSGREIYLETCRVPGFRESQVIVPFAAWPRFVERLERLLRDTGVRTTLGSLKIFRGEPELLYFRRDGVCLAVDVPEQRGSAVFFAGLDRAMLDAGGIPNISKDSRLSAETVAAAYPGYAEFRAKLGELEPTGRMRSALRSRLHV